MNLHVFKMDTWQYLLCFKSDFDAVKSKIGLLNEYFKSVHLLPPTVSVPPQSIRSPSLSVPLFGYLRCFKSDFDAVKSKIGRLDD